MTNKQKLKLWGALIPALAGITIATLRFGLFDKLIGKKNEPLYNYSISGTVVEEGTNNSVAQAKISIVGKNEYYYTENDGNFHITLSDHSLREVRIRVTKDPMYIPYDKTFDLPSEGYIIVLVKKQ
jgi:hypothetical protein